MKVLVLSAVAAGCAFSAQALAANYSCQADLVARNGRVLTSNVGDGFSRSQACDNALDQCQNDLITFNQQGLHRGARCVANNRGPGFPNPGPFPPNPGNSFDISCESNNFNREYCFVGRSAYAARLLQRYSSADCSLGRTFGIQGEYLWVDQGCRGRFAIYTR